ncbi:MAG: hypothetical protein FWG64_03040 [Firmicutes bacterium]|nr:hypothetical protein [Bacillota bacterium]
MSNQVKSEKSEKKTIGWTLSDFHKTKRNSTERKQVIITMEVDGEKIERPILISKMLAEEPHGYKKSRKAKTQNTKNVFEVLLNNVFEVETGEPLFREVDILAESDCATVEEYLNEHIPPSMTAQIMQEVSDFSGVKPRQQEVDEIKN